MSSESIKTEAVAAGVAKTNPIKLDHTPETHIEFQAKLHTAGVSGSIVKYKKDRSRNWSDLARDNFSSHALSAMEKIEIPLSTEALQNLISQINLRGLISEEGVKSGIHEYVPVEKNKAIIVNDQNVKLILEEILGKGYAEEVWTLIASEHSSLADRLIIGHLQLQREDVLKDLMSRLDGSYFETKGQDSWQEWVFKHNWLFGANYEEPVEKQKINIGGAMPDYLFPTVDGFIDVLEIKLPSEEVIVEDRSHPGSWRWDSVTNSALGQVVNYVCEIDRLRYEIEKSIKLKCGRDISCLKPRAYILVGNSQLWPNQKKEALRKLNHSLHGIEVLTYFDLLQRGKRFSVSPIAGISAEGESDNPF